MKKEKWILALEFGGQSVKAASVNSKGDLKNVSRFKLDQKNPLSFSEFKSRLKFIIMKARSDRQVFAVGVSAPNPWGGSLVFNLKQKPSYKNINGKSLKGLILKVADCKKFYVENDAVAAARGEIWKGEKSKRFMFLTLGTGLGGSFIVNGKIVKGRKFGATTSGELWNYKFRGENLEENIGTTKSMVRIYNRLGGKNKRVLKGDVEYLANRARGGNVLAVRTFKVFGNLLGEGLVELVRKFKPKTIILSGNIANAYDLFGRNANKMLSNCLKYFIVSRKVVFKKSKLIGNGGLIGVSVKGFKG